MFSSLIFLLGSFFAFAEQSPSKTSILDGLKVDTHLLNWRPYRLRKPIVDLAVKNKTLYALDSEGNLYQKRLRRPFQLILRSDSETTESGIEEILLDVEFSIEENSSAIETELTTDFETTDIFGETQDNVEFMEGVEGDINDSIFDPIRGMDYDGEGRGLIWANPKNDDLIVCRVDSCLISQNKGVSWKPTVGLDQAIEIYSFDTLNLLFAATQNGLLISNDNGRRWQKKALSGLTVRDIAYDGSLLYTATEKGLYLSQDGILWNRIVNSGFKSSNMNFVHADSTVLGELWSATKDEFLRSDDYGQSFSSIGNKAPDQVYQLDSLWHNHQLAAISSSGIWFSNDNGIIWHLIKKGIGSSPPLDVVVWQDKIICASEAGVFYLAKDDDSQQTQIKIDTTELHRLLDSSLYSVEQQLRVLQISNPLLRGLSTPTLRMWGSFDRNLTLTADYGAISAHAQDNGQYDFGLEFCFGACSSLATTSISAAQQDSVMVIGNEVFSSETSGIAPAAANVQFKLQQQRRRISDSVTSLYGAHQRLKAKTAQLNNRSLLDQIMHEIEMQEIVSRLDALSLGLYYKNSIQKD